MAEIAIPLIALGSMYVISNQGSSKKENYSNINHTNMTNTPNELTNVNPPVPPVNYPNLVPVDDTNVKYYPNPNQTTDKFFNGEAEKNIPNQNTNYGVGGSNQQHYSLTGEVIDPNNFKHINMVPFFGAKIKGASANYNNSESILDNMQGTGSQFFKKTERAPLFEPQKNMQFANGTPNMSDFFQSRVNPGMRMANVKPWEEVTVAPALNKKGGWEGSAGYNSGMEARDMWLPKTVDQLRTSTNPKLTFGLSGHEGPADAYVKDYASQEQQGKVEKYRPDAFFNNTPDRWLTTTGIEKAQTARSIELLQDVNRVNTTREYFGTMGNTDVEATYVKPAVEPAKRPELEPIAMTHASAVGKSMPTTADYGSQGFTNYHNNRSTTRPDRNLGIVSGVMKAVVSPLLDVLRPSRKENVVGNLRPNGVAGTTVSNAIVYNPADRTKTTIREMTGSNVETNHMNVQGVTQNNTGYLVTGTQVVNQQRDSTNIQYEGNAGPNGFIQPRTYDAEYNQRNNVNKTYASRANGGCNQVFNQVENISIHKRDCDRENNRWWIRSPGSTYIGNATPSAETYGKITGRQYYDEGIMCERINPDILTAFKNNPYTQSLYSYA